MSFVYQSRPRWGKWWLGQRVVLDDFFVSCYCVTNHIYWVYRWLHHYQYWITVSCWSWCLLPCWYLLPIPAYFAMPSFVMWLRRPVHAVAVLYHFTVRILYFLCCRSVLRCFLLAVLVYTDAIQRWFHGSFVCTSVRLSVCYSCIVSKPLNLGLTSYYVIISQSVLYRLSNCFITVTASTLKYMLLRDSWLVR